MVRVSCLMPTRDRRGFVPRAVETFLAQEHDGQAELVVLDDGDDAVADLMPKDPRVRYVRLRPALVLGAKRNVACALARGSVLVHWDDDDVSAPDRIARQVEALEHAELCGTSRMFFRDDDGRGWLYAYPEPRAGWLAGSSLAYRRELWLRHPFERVAAGEDSRFVLGTRAARVDLADPELVIGTIHAGNTAAKARGASWQAWCGEPNCKRSCRCRTSGW